MSDGETAASGCAIRVSKVSKSFVRDGNELAVLSNVSLDIEPGEIISVIGRSGAGKSTLLRLICGLFVPDSGNVTVGATAASDARLAKHIGFMPQSPALLPWLTILQNVEIVREINPGAHAGKSAADALGAVGLSDVHDARPHELSGGMQHRVALARALCVGGPLLALDEPFGSLDEITRSNLYDLLLSTGVKDRRTIVMVTHNLDEAVLLSDRVVVLDGTPAEVRGVVTIAGERPRRAAIERGEYADVLALIRSLLEGVAA